MSELPSIAEKRERIVSILETETLSLHEFERLARERNKLTVKQAIIAPKHYTPGYSYMPDVYTMPKAAQPTN